jgi:hypothetical protein
MMTSQIQTYTTTLSEKRVHLNSSTAIQEARHLYLPSTTKTFTVTVNHTLAAAKPLDISTKAQLR